MPITYSDHQHSSEIDAPSSSNLTTIQDTDSSIVLSDLLRSGESSRLRRRGAVRLDHAHNTQPSMNNPSEEKGAYSRLYCKECDAPCVRPLSKAVSSPSTPYRPSLFPLPSSSINPKSQDQPRPSLERTLVHTRAVAQRLPHIDVSLHVHPPSSSIYPPTSAQVFAFLARIQRNSDAHSAADADVRDPDTENGVLVWSAVSDAVEGVVVPMHYENDSDQVSDTGAEHTVRSMDIAELARHRPGPISTACMCKREVVACAVCGSPLGMRYTPCSSAMKKIFPPPPPHVPSPSQNHRANIVSSSNLPPPSHLRFASISSSAEATAYRSRIADYLLAMSTPRSTRTTPSPPDTIHVTPEMHNAFDRAQPFEVSILPRSITSQDHNTATTSYEQTDANHEVENGVAEDGPRVRSGGSSDTESDTEDEGFTSENDDHYRLPMITQTNRNDSSCPSGHWTHDGPTKYVYRFFAEAVVSEEPSKAPFRTGLSSVDWHRLYASVYGLGQGGSGRRLSCG